MFLLTRTPACRRQLWGYAAFFLGPVTVVMCGRGLSQYGRVFVRISIGGDVSSPFQEGSDGRIFFEADGNVVGLAGFVAPSSAGQQVSSCRPPRLILGESRVRGEGLKRIESGLWPVAFGDGEGAIDGDDR